jgi:hypothetical protein
MAEAHGAEAHAPHAADEHATDDVHGHDDHGRGAAMGPIDVRAWGALAVGIAFGLVVVLALVQALS